MGEMTHRHRVLAALNHQEPDRVPVDLGATRTTSIVVQAYERLNAHLGAKEDARIFSKWLNIAHPSQAMLARFDIDTRSVSQGSPDHWQDILYQDGVSYQDEWSVVRSRPAGSLYYDLTKPPFRGDATVADIAKSPWPVPHDPGRCRGMAEAAFRANTARNSSASRRRSSAWRGGVPDLLAQATAADPVREVAPAAGQETKTGYSTDEEVLEQLASQHELPAQVLAHRKLSKLKNTYVDALPQSIDPRSGRIHPTFHQLGAATGRLSATRPNVQNIPIRTPEGVRIREAFVPAEGCRLISADYSQVELRILAHYSDDASLIDAFARGEDVHRRTAARSPASRPRRSATSSARARSRAESARDSDGMIGDNSLSVN